MKNFYFLFLGVLFLASCSKDDDNCSSKTFEEVVIGSWNIQILGQTLSQVTIKSDGTYTDDGGEDLISVGSNTTSRTWAISGKTLTFTVKDASGDEGETFFNYSSHTCDNIVFEENLFGQITFKRK
ncbi:MAG: hypothetical protein H6567_04025 [Lewinellaceae bacterium]|nr:hypothetical protein [Lewinellaceae bacterium]